MSLPSAAVHRPVFTTMVVLILVLLGGFSLNMLPLDLMPELTMPVIVVRTTYENAAPGEIEEQITKPLERALVAVPGVDEMSSTSMEGSSTIAIKFDWGINLDEASNDIRDRIDRVINRLPEDIDRPVLQKFDTAARAIMFLGVASNFHPVDLKRYIEDEISYRLERNPGVASAQGFGGLDREIRVEVDEAKVKALGLDLFGLVTMIQRENLSEAGGEIDRGRLSVAVRTKGEFSSVDEIGSILVARTKGGTPVRLADIADIRDGWARVIRITRINGQEGQFMGVFKQSGSNTVAVANSVHNAVEVINNTLTNAHITPLMDSSTFIKQAIATVTDSTVKGGLLAVLVILIFLQNIRSTFVLALAIPISIIPTFMVMYFFGLTLNVVTMGALALGVGMLVDNAIVVLDNIFRLRSTGLDATEAAIKGTEEVNGAIIASTLTTLSVFLPMIFLQDLAGVIFRPFSWTIAFSLTLSLFVAQTLVPMLSSKLMKDTLGPDGKPVVFGRPRYGAKYFKLVDSTYMYWLERALKRPGLVVFISLFLLALTVIPWKYMGTEFLPRTDESAFEIIVTMEPGTRVEATSDTVRMIEAVIKEEIPEMVSMAADIGGLGGQNNRTSSYAEVLVRLRPVVERERSVFEIMETLRPRFTSLPGTTVRLRASQSFMAFGSGSDRIQVELRGNDQAESTRLAKAMKQIIEHVPGVTDVYLSNEDASQEEMIVIDRGRAADAGLSVSSISSLIKTAVGGTTAGYFRENGKEYDITVLLKDSQNLSIDSIMKLPVTNNSGQSVILANVAQAVHGTSPLLITRKNQARVVYINADMTDRALGDVVADIDRELKALPMGSDFSYAFIGETEEQAKTFRGLLMVLSMAIFLVYMVMACQFEQLKGPLVVMFSLPFGAIGVVWGHFLTNTAFNINSFIGVIMLAGIVVNNAIILIDHANLLIRRDGMDVFPALLETGRRRLRPIMMTTLTTILGLIPLALGFGEGGESQASMGRAVIGGLTTSTFITLFLVPSIYKLFFQKEDLKRKAAPPETVTAPTGDPHPTHGSA
ncbi:MAG: efflux RND transporter permease subunit [Deltaproteobacteria bacterium]|jgi:HAE1 family hydrophobic/amphiphilic exporter-1|nr:efflux RND transporter permease subunit [Deltaproteobacteria bacterium]